MVAATSLVRAVQIVLDEVDRALRPFEVTFARYECLVLLSFTRTGALPLGKIGRRLQVHPTSVTNTVDRLAAQHLVKRVVDRRDRRVVLAEITPAGRELVVRATEELTKVRFGLGSLADSDLAVLAETIGRLRKASGDFAGSEGDAD
jgi:DNA-binding MarR family transcriptional regulator